MPRYLTVLVLCVSIILFPLTHSVCLGEEDAKSGEVTVMSEEGDVGRKAAPARYGGAEGLSAAAWAGIAAGAIAVGFIVDAIADDGGGGTPSTHTPSTHTP
jgi:hypothetical protein